MAYSNGIVYVNFQGGTSNPTSAAATINSVVFSNPSGSTVRGTKIGHGLITGQIISISNTSNFNGKWKITKITNDAFDLDEAIWTQAGGVDNTGDVIPALGASWATAYSALPRSSAFSFDPGCTTIRVAKTQDPYSCGNATWTYNNSVVSLASAQTQVIDNCESGWVAVTGSVSQSATRKEGSFSTQIVAPSPLSATLYAYKTLPSTLDLSQYQQITFWFYFSVSDSVLTRRFQILLCSDANGTVPVDTFNIDETSMVFYGTNQWHPLVKSRVGGGNLGSNINSVAIYCSATGGTTSTTILLDNINACYSNNINLLKLISKNGLSPDDISDGWWSIKSINGTSVTLDSTYVGTTETVQSYTRDVAKVYGRGGASATNEVILQNGSMSAGQMVYSFGWDTGSNTKDGMTIIDCRGQIGRFWYESNYNNVTVENMGILGFYGLFASLQFRNFIFDKLLSLVDAGSTSNGKNILKNSTFVSVPQISWAGGPHSFINCNFYNTSAAHSLLLSNGGNRLHNCNFSNLSLGDIDCRSYKDTILTNCNFKSTSTNITTNTILDTNFSFKDCVFSGTTPITVPSANSNRKIFSQNHNLTSYAYGVTDGGTFNTEDSDRAIGKTWRLVLTNTTRTSLYPLDLSVGQFAVSANNLVTITAWMKKSHATNCDGRLRVRGYQIAGVDTDQIATLANNTSWQQLTITFTPTEAGVFEVEALAEYVAGNANVYIDQIEVTQA